MTIPATLAITSASVALLAALLAVGMSSAPGWRHLRWFAVCATCGALFNLFNAPVTIPSMSESALLLSSRLNLAFGGLHAASWFMYIAVREERRLTRIDRVFVVLGVVWAFVAIVPGAVVQGHVVPRTVAFLDVTYRDPPPTSLGGAAIACYVSALLYLFARSMHRWLAKGERNDRPLAIALGAVLLGGIHDSLAANDVIRSPYLLDVSLLVLVLAVGGSLTSSFVASARALEASSRELAAAQSQLVTKERLAAIGELSAVVAHEVRNPLAVVFNAIAGLRRARPGEREHGKLVDILQEEAERLRDIVSDLLEFASPRPPLLAMASLSEIVASAIASARSATGADEADVTLDVVDDVRIECDERLVRQAVVNLVANALQATGRSSPVRVTITDGRDNARIRVEDDGDGIPEELRERIFTPFFSTRPKGTGLGLAVVRRCADAHGGDVTLDRGRERGAAFTLRLPVRSTPRIPPE